MTDARQAARAKFPHLTTASDAEVDAFLARLVIARTLRAGVRR
jgi:hypothetical protein